MREEIAISAQR